MLQVIFDTNIYGKIITDDEEVIEKLRKSNLLVLNFALIRDELRKTSQAKVFKAGRKVRVSLLGTYDRIVTNKRIPVMNEIKKLADAFYDEYRRLGGGVGKKSIIDDFKIVACATIKNCDIIASEDKRTMQSPKALSAYAVVAVKAG